MPALTPDDLSRHRREISLLRKGGKLSSIQIVLIGLAVILLLNVLPAIMKAAPKGPDYSQLRIRLAQSHSVWVQELLAREDSYNTWLDRWGSRLETRAFDGISNALLSALTSVADTPREELPFWARSWLSLLSGLLRISFIILACWRIWLLAIIAGLYRSWSRQKAHHGNDMLGETGTGNLFYSGIRAGLSDPDEQGRPRLLVTGLACPRRAADKEVDDSQLVRLLAEYQALNETTRTLAAIIHAYPEHPGYVADREDELQLKSAFNAPALPETAALILRAAFAARDLMAVNHPAPVPVNSPAPLPPGEYQQVLISGLIGVLTPALRHEIVNTPLPVLAATVLALEAGKVMTYSFEGGRWLRRSSFQQLCARSILHSTGSFGAEYGTQERTDVRRALVYSSRKSVFAPVSFPADLSERCRALRQWTELLMALPHQISSVRSEIELLGITTEVHRTWEQLFIRSVSTGDTDLLQGSWVAGGALLLVPLKKLLRSFQLTIDRPRMDELIRLATLVSQHQQVRSLSVDGELPRADRTEVARPLSFQEMKDLSARHAVSLDELRDWSALRVVLGQFSWLARRVGDNTVPDSSVVYTALHAEGEPGANAAGIVGLKGMVPLRTTRLSERAGRQWAAPFHQAARALMAETPEDYERLLKGETVAPEDELDKDAGGA